MKCIVEYFIVYLRAKMQLAGSRQSFPMQALSIAILCGMRCGGIRCILLSTFLYIGIDLNHHRACKCYPGQTFVCTSLCPASLATRVWQAKYEIWALPDFVNYR